MFGKKQKVLQIAPAQIEPSPFQARTAFDETEISALAVSILQNGLLQPISVRKIGAGRYQLVAGERRLRACRAAGLDRVPAILADYNDSQSAALGLLENMQRQQLDPFDTARGIKEVIALWGCTQSEAAKRLGLSQPALANKLRLLALNPAQEQLCTKAGLTERHARAVLRLPPELRTQALERVVGEQMSVRQADKLVEKMLENGAPPPKEPRMGMVRDLRIFFNTVEHAVDVMVQGGVNATTRRTEGDDYIEYTVRIPTAAVHRG